MTTSSYYDLKIMEGSDKVNPLTIDAANYESIDEILHDNAIAGVSLATELLAGTVHAITRSNDECATFRFIATSPMTTGDTFTVDGVQVTALQPNGQPLADNAFVIGSNVLCILTASTLTVYASGAGKASDSDKLNGQPASYYATAEAVGSASSLAQAAGTIAQAAQTAINEVTPKVTGLTPTLAWSNINPSTSFSGQTITLDDSYNLLIVTFRIKTTSSIKTTLLVLESAAMTMPNVADTNTTDKYYRNVTNNGAEIVFGNGVRMASSQSINNDYLIPISIYGIKF